MYLKRLEIQGFKSFADRIALEFDTGITAIIGPNGSGKSNISDAVRWALGEQSLKSLRGNIMEDVIFSGTEHRRPSGFAEVSIVFDNEHRRLPLDYSEVSVTRRVYRSGESEYYINKNRCRLKDITELFYDTGVGKDGYSIVGQGRVDDILNNKPEERRLVFEEATGIMKYKMRKLEAEKKLESTRQNILRIRDILTELELQLDTLKRQAADAKRYLALRDELKAIEVGAFIVNIARYRKEIKKCENDFSAGNDELELVIKNTSAVERESEEKKARASFLDEMLKNIREDIFFIESGMADIENEIKLNKEKINGCLSGVSRIENEISQFSKRNVALGSELEANNKKASYLENEMARYNEKLDEAKARYNEILVELGESDRRIEEMKAEADSLQERIYDKRNYLGKLQTEISSLNKNVDAVEKNIRQIILETDNDKILLDELNDNIAGCNTKIAGVKKEIRELEDERDKHGLTVKNIEKESISKLSELSAKKSGLKILEDMEEKMEGFNYSVKNILKRCKENPGFGKGIYGAVASLITVSQKYETALDMALGQAQQNIVTDDDEAAKRAVNYLKNTNGGRVTFLPISSVRATTVDGNTLAALKGEDGFLGAAYELIGYDKKHDKAIKYLLGKTIIVGDIDDATRIAGEYRHAFKIVTLDGDIISQGGSVTGGSAPKREGGILTRHRQIAQLGSEIPALEKSVAELNKRMRAAKESIEKASAALKQREPQLNEAALERAKIESEISHIGERIKSNTIRVDISKNEKKEVLQAIKELGAVIEGESKNLDGFSVHLASIKKEVLKHTEKNKEEQEKRDGMLADISNYNVSVASVNESYKSAEENIRRIKTELAGSEKGLSKKKLETAKMKKDIEDLRLENIALAKKIEGKETEKKGKNLQSESATAEKQAVLDDILMLADDFARNNETAEILRKELSRLDVKKARLNVELENLQNRLWDEYELTYANALAMKEAADAERRAADAERRAADAEAGAVGATGAEAGTASTASTGRSRAGSMSRIAELKEEIRKLGFVNVQAIDMFTETKIRYDKMLTQQNDMEEACEKLKVVIGEMVAIIRKNFSVQFERINENFNIVFRDLFNGGQARLKLSDNTDVLSAGVEIEIQLPGKKMQNMMLYSSGERAMTAIALVFAILKLNPPPFCLLDEIESTLDEANVYRLSNYIHNYCDNTQFIMVTHRKGTMEGSNTMFGVTMQERGVSGIVSLRIGA